MALALQDKKPNARMAAASALGSMQAQHAKVELEGALQDSQADGGPALEAIVPLSEIPARKPSAEPAKP